MNALRCVQRHTWYGIIHDRRLNNVQFISVARTTMCCLLRIAGAKCADSPF